MEIFLIDFSSDQIKALVLAKELLRPIATRIIKNDRSKNYYWDNKESENKRRIKYKNANREKDRESARLYAIRHPDRKKKAREVYNAKNREELARRQRVWRKNNPQYSNYYAKKKRQEDPCYRAIKNFRTRLTKFGSRARAKTKSPRFEFYFGCSPEFYIKHIEYQFTEGMSWDNYKEWQIDHILPLSLGNNEQDWVMLNHYTNLRPMWAVENTSKSDSLPDSIPPNFPHWQHFLHHFEL